MLKFKLFESTCVFISADIFRQIDKDCGIIFFSLMNHGIVLLPSISRITDRRKVVVIKRIDFQSFVFFFIIYLINGIERMRFPFWLQIKIAYK